MAPHHFFLHFIQVKINVEPKELAHAAEDETIEESVDANEKNPSSANEDSVAGEDKSQMGGAMAGGVMSMGTTVEKGGNSLASVGTGIASMGTGANQFGQAWLEFDKNIPFGL